MTLTSPVTHFCGSVLNPRKWWRITQEPCNQYIFSHYMDYVHSDIENHPVDGRYDAEKYFMWDNLRVHQTPMVTAAVWNYVQGGMNSDLYQLQDHRTNQRLHQLNMFLG